MLKKSTSSLNSCNFEIILSSPNLSKDKRKLLYFFSFCDSRIKLHYYSPSGPSCCNIWLCVCQIKKMTICCRFPLFTYQNALLLAIWSLMLQYLALCVSSRAPCPPPPTHTHTRAPCRVRCCIYIVDGPCRRLRRHLP